MGLRNLVLAVLIGTVPAGLQHQRQALTHQRLVLAEDYAQGPSRPKECQGRGGRRRTADRPGSSRYATQAR
jgi:hypothetical protein